MQLISIIRLSIIKKKFKIHTNLKEKYMQAVATPAMRVR